MTQQPVPSPGRAVDDAVPTGDRLAAAYLLGIADDAMVYAQRLGEWLTNAPQIEEDMALANVSLDLLGQARGLYAHIGELDGTGRSEDDFAMLRDERQWRNVHLVEQERQDFGFEMARLLWFSAYQVELYAAAAGSSDETFRAVAREGDQGGRLPPRPRAPVGGAARRRHRGVAPPDAGRPSRPYSLIWPSCSTTTRCRAPRPRPVSACCRRRCGTTSTARVGRIVSEATLELPETPRWRSRGGRQGVHSAPMGYLLAEMQHVARSHPGATW